MNVTKSQAKVLECIYMATDCSNAVYDYATLHHTQQKIADSMPRLVKSIGGVLSVDGNGFMAEPERYGRGFRLTKSGYKALTKLSPERWPESQRRFA